MWFIAIARSFLQRCVSSLTEARDMQAGPDRRGTACFPELCEPVHLESRTGPDVFRRAGVL